MERERKSEMKEDEGRSRGAEFKRGEGHEESREG